MALHPFDEPHADIALVHIALEDKFRHGGDQMLLPVLAFYDIDVVGGRGHDVGQPADGRFAVVDRQTQKIRDKDAALRQLRVGAVDRDDLIAQGAGGLHGVDARELDEHAGLLHAGGLHPVGAAADPERVKLQQKLRAVGPGQKLDLAAHAVRADDLSGLLDTSKISAEQLLPPYSGKLPQPFYSAPGSGYASHHAYPGGLATHTAANLCISEGIYNTYKVIFNSDISRDIIISAQALHDLAKPLVFQWQKDQASLPEYTIAATGAHHILSIAEVIYRGFPVEEVVAQACAHTIPTGKDEQVVAGYLKAAAIIAGKDAVKLGLVNSDNTIPTPHKQEGYIVSLGDHDFVLSSPACQKSVAILKQIAAKDYGMTKAELEGEHFNRFRNYIGAQYSMMYIDSLASTKNGMERIRQAVKNVIVK